MLIIPSNPLMSRALAAVVLIGTCAVQLLGGPLDQATERLITRTDLGGGTTSIYIADLDTGKELASYNGSRAMIPASNMKLLTSGAALFVLGNDFTFRTELIIDHSSTPPTLIVKGDGDPALGDPAIFIGEEPGVTLDSLFDQIGEALGQAGITELEKIIIDDQVLDRNYTHPSWPADQLNRWYCAQVGGLNFHTNVINVYTTPSTSGGSPSIHLQPYANWVDIRIKAKSNMKKRDTAWVSRPTMANSFTVHGNVGAKSEIPVAIDSPPLFSGHLFANELTQRGILIGESLQDPTTGAVSLIDPEVDYNRSKVVAVITTPLFDVLERTNTDSHNLYAEALLKRVGHEITSDPGSWENGSTVIRMLLTEKLGSNTVEKTVIADGSGMSRMNRVAPQTIVQWIRKLSRSDHWELFQDSLASPGNGTLKSRFTREKLQSKLYAKSGYLTGTYSLSGVLVHPQTGQRVVFSIMVNNVKPGATSRNAKPMVDKLVKEIDTWMSR
jgi:serine-type D-Ala-D-Ala carboxypeptidase/endopeptidase (penicillin-binding protein 4)